MAVDRMPSSQQPARLAVSGVDERSRARSRGRRSPRRCPSVAGDVAHLDRAFLTSTLERLDARRAPRAARPRTDSAGAAPDRGAEPRSACPRLGRRARYTAIASQTTAGDAAMKVRVIAPTGAGRRLRAGGTGGDPRRRWRSRQRRRSSDGPPTRTSGFVLVDDALYRALPRDLLTRLDRQAAARSSRQCLPRAGMSGARPRRTSWRSCGRPSATA